MSSSNEELKFVTMYVHLSQYPLFIILDKILGLKNAYKEVFFRNLITFETDQLMGHDIILSWYFICA